MSRLPTEAVQPRRRRPIRPLWNRIATFILLFSAVLLGVNAFVCATVVHFAGLPQRTEWQVFPAVLTLGFILATIIGRFYSGLALRSFYSLSAAWLGLLNYGFFAAIACWLMDGLLALVGWPVDGRYLAEFCFDLAVLAAVAGIIIAAWIRVTRVTVALPHLPEAWKSRNVALISDVHLGHVGGPFFLRRVIATLRRTHPDIVLVAGDMFDGTKDGIERLVQPWSEISVPLGIHFVTGNHDEFADRKKYLAALANVGVRALNNEKIVIDGVQILGVHDGEAGHADSFRAVLQRMRIDRGAPSILLAHKPENLSIAEEEGVSLQVSGHTHRGQLWPWTLIVRRVYRQFAYGLNRLGDLQVYTSSGVGTWGPPLRLGTRSEIVLFRFVSA